jgi:hypothetical protein
MNTVAGQWLWKWKLMAGVLTIVPGAIVLAWPGPTILVASTLFGVYLLVSGLAELFMAFTRPRPAATRVMLFISGALSVVFPSLRRRLRGAAAVAVDRNRLHLPRRPRGRRRCPRRRLARPRIVRRRRHSPRLHRHHPNRPSAPNP